MARILSEHTRDTAAVRTGARGRGLGAKSTVGRSWVRGNNVTTSRLGLRGLLWYKCAALRGRLAESSFFFRHVPPGGYVLITAQRFLTADPVILGELDPAILQDSLVQARNPPGTALRNESRAVVVLICCKAWFGYAAFVGSCLHDISGMLAFCAAATHSRTRSSG
eukprot:3609019-Rhodomonas_salina.3